MESLLKRLMACGVPKERAERIVEAHRTTGKWHELENYVIVLEMHQKGRV